MAAEIKQVNKGGRPLTYQPNDLMDKFDEYIQYCKDNKLLLPNIAGFCRFIDIARETYYDWRDNESRGMSDSIKRIEQGLEDAALQCKDPAKSIFYLKNKFGYVDKQEIEQVGQPQNVLNINVLQLPDRDLKQLEDILTKAIPAPEE